MTFHHLFPQVEAGSDKRAVEAAAAAHLVDLEVQAIEVEHRTASTFHSRSPVCRVLATHSRSCVFQLLLHPIFLEMDADGDGEVTVDEVVAGK